MSSYGGSEGRKLKHKPVFKAGKRGGPGSRLLAWIVLIIIVLSQCNAAMPLQGCLQEPAAIQYIATLYVPNESGEPDMDWQNDYLADVTNVCQPVVQAVGRGIAGE